MIIVLFLGVSPTIGLGRTTTLLYLEVLHIDSMVILATSIYLEKDEKKKILKENPVLVHHT